MNTNIYSVFNVTLRNNSLRGIGVHQWLATQAVEAMASK